jgi:hypothetical protein
VIEGARKQVQAAAGDLRAVRERLLGVQRSIPPSAQEVSPGDLVGEPDGETEIRTVIANGIENCLNPLIEDLDAAADEGVSGTVERSLPSIANLDLGVYAEATRRTLYEIVAAEIFGPTEPASGKGSAEPYTPDRAGLEVVFLWGRWFAVWWKLGLPGELPEAKRRVTLLLEENQYWPGTLAYRVV